MLPLRRGLLGRAGQLGEVEGEEGCRNGPFAVHTLDPVTGQVNKRTDFRLLWLKQLPLACQGLVSRGQRVMLVQPLGLGSTCCCVTSPVFLVSQREGDSASMAQVWGTRASPGRRSLVEQQPASLPPASPPPLLPQPGVPLRTFFVMESSAAGRRRGWGRARGSRVPRPFALLPGVDAFAGTPVRCNPFLFLDCFVQFQYHSM